MPAYVSNESIQQVQTLLKGGASFREIQEETGVSRGTVGNIKSGRRKPTRAMRRPNECFPQKVVAYHCEGCGCTVTTEPCWFCYNRELADPRGPQRRRPNVSK